MGRKKLASLKDSYFKQRENKTEVEESRHFRQYDRWIRSGWSSRLCSRMAYEVYAEKISHKSFLRYRKKIPKREILGSSWSPSEMAEVEVMIDKVVVLENCLMEQFRRMALARDLEEKSGFPPKQMDTIIGSVVKIILSLHVIERQLPALLTQEPIVKYKAD